jgi:hypothetical protein
MQLFHEEKQEQKQEERKHILLPSRWKFYWVNKRKRDSASFNAEFDRSHFMFS